MITKLKYQLKYILRKVAMLFCLCPKCWQRVNYTSAGRPICPNCGR